MRLLYYRIALQLNILYISKELTNKIRSNALFLLRKTVFCLSESDAFHQRVREGYERVKELYPQRIHVVDAHQSIDEVKEACIREIRMLLKPYE